MIVEILYYRDNKLQQSADYSGAGNLVKTIAKDRKNINGCNRVDVVNDTDDTTVWWTGR